MRVPTYEDVRTGKLSEDLFYSSLSYTGSLQLLEADDLETYFTPEEIEDRELAVDTLVISEMADGAAPWMTYDEFHDCWDCRPERWEQHVTDGSSDYCECGSCYEYREEQRRYDEDTYDPYGQQTTDDPGVAEGPMSIVSLPNRPTRLVSTEIEVGMGGNYLAEEFYRAGLSAFDYMLDYHSGEDDFVRVEEDASVAAEVIFSKMDLANPKHISKYEEGIAIIRKAINDGACKLDMRCGLHIHIGVNRTKGYRGRKIPGYTSQNLTSLYHLWNYLEDTIFRLASANWKGHRSEFGNDYAPPTRKGRNSAAEASYDRASLNMGNFLEACRYNIPNYDHPATDWSRFDLSEGRPTIEFRVFNTSANARKLRAYIALCQALVAAAQETIYTPDLFPPHAWTGHNECDNAASAERITFIMEQLPLTDDEKADLAYCIERCSLSTAIA